MQFCEFAWGRYEPKEYFEIRLWHNLPDRLDGCVKKWQDVVELAEDIPFRPLRSLTFQSQQTNGNLTVAALNAERESYIYFSDNVSSNVN